MRAAVMVEMPIPSPMKRITFLARVGGGALTTRSWPGWHAASGSAANAIERRTKRFMRAPLMCLRLGIVRSRYGKVTIRRRAPNCAAMPMLSVATWNINSVRLRLPQVERFLTEQSPDVLCLQEIKCQEHQFPYEAFRAAGYAHIAVHGQKGYHGVATVSRVPIRDFSKHDWQDNGEARHIGVELTDPAMQGMVIENVYI